MINYFDQEIECPECGKKHARRDWPVFPSSGKPRRTCCLTTGDNKRKEYLKRFKIVDGIECAFCSSCKEHVPVSEFHKDRHRIKNICKRCHAERYKNYKSPSHVEASKEAAKKKSDRMNEVLHCERCGNDRKRRDWPTEPKQNRLLKHCCGIDRLNEMRSLRDNGLKKCSDCEEILPLSNFNQRNGRCKPCQSAYATIFGSRDKRRQQIADRSDGTLHSKSISKLFREATECPVCSVSMKWKDKTLDHIVPLCNDGEHSVKNVIVMCRSCNQQKFTKNLQDWLGSLPRQSVQSYKIALSNRQELSHILRKVEEWLLEAG